MIDTDPLQLPVEVWGKVFACVKPNCKSLQDVYTRPDKAVAQQAQLHQLRLVCTKFNEVIEQHPELLDQLVPGRLSWQSWPSLLCWLQRYRSNVRVFTPLCSADCQTLLLGVLACPSSQLTEVFLPESGMPHIHALSVFTTITKCSLSDPENNEMDLKPLHGLHSLQDMCLEYGRYSNAPISSHLTRLDVDNSIASCVQLACGTPGLKDLIVYNAELFALHDDGVLSCSGLTSLDVLNCAISGSNTGAHFTLAKDYMLCIPPNISTLTQLRQLRVAMTTVSNGLGASWTYCLTSLNSLDLLVEGVVTLSHDLTQLQQLSMLTVAAEPWCESDLLEGAASMARFEVDWKAMHNLQRIVLSGYMILLDNIQEVSLLKDLSFVSITDVHPGDCQTVVHLARLANNLAANRPHVQFKVETPVVPVASAALTDLD